MTFSVASNNDISELSKLWRTCFGDTSEYVAAFMNDCFEPQNTIVVREDGVICSALYLIDGKVRISDEYFNAAYLYAACTHPDYRSRGFMGTALDFAELKCEEKGLDFICLVPAEESLFNYYSNFGYAISFEEKVLTLSRKQLELLSNRSVRIGVPDADDISSVFADMLLGEDCFVWETDKLSYAIKENANAECEITAAFSSGVCTAYALFYHEDGCTVVRECASVKGRFSDLASALLSKSTDNSFKFRLPLSYPLSADSFDVRCSAMLLPLNTKSREAIIHIKNAYMGFTLG